MEAKGAGVYYIIRFLALQIPDEPEKTLSPRDDVSLISRIIFYILSTASIPLYLIIIITICVTK